MSAISRIDLVGDSADGRLWILDVAAAPAVPVAEPAQRMPTVSLGSLRVADDDALLRLRDPARHQRLDVRGPQAHHVVDLVAQLPEVGTTPGEAWRFVP